MALATQSPHISLERLRPCLSPVGRMRDQVFPMTRSAYEHLSTSCTPRDRARFTEIWLIRFSSIAQWSEIANNIGILTQIAKSHRLSKWSAESVRTSLAARARTRFDCYHQCYCTDQFIDRPMNDPCDNLP